MDTITFVKLWPGGNTTALVVGKFPHEQYVSIARKILAENKIIEQVGFLEKPENSKAAIRLQMMGGEFCGNATRATAYYWAMKTGLKSFKMEVSGFPELMETKITGEEVELKLPGAFFQKIESGKIKIVDLMGIRFIIQQFPKDLNEARKLISKFKGTFPAVGILYTSFEDKNITIDPIVWVRETNTCYNETACGSGSIAAGIVNFIKNPKKKTFLVTQPSGEVFIIKIQGSKNKILNIIFSGIVEYRGEQSINNKS